jgi:hypothetical protein
MARYATMFGHLLGVADTLVNGAVEVAIAGEPDAEDFRALAAAVAKRYVPGLVMAGGTGKAVAGMALMESRSTTNGHATAYMCKAYACKLPAVSADALSDQLAVTASDRR